MAASARFLIIPDLHHHAEHADFWIQQFPGRRVIFLGDYFDDFRDHPSDAAAMAEWVKHKVESEPTWVFLVGNHDLPYLYPLDERFMGPGFHLSKREEIGAVIKGLDRSRFQLHLFVEPDLLFSHAGLHPGWLRHQRREVAADFLEEAEQCVLTGKWHPLLSWGQDRGGVSSDPTIGGIVWMDWSNLRPLRFAHQIVGHTPDRFPRHKTVHEVFNLCLDVGHAMACATLDHEGVNRIVRVYQRDGGEGGEAFRQVLEHNLPRLGGEGR